IEERSGGLFAIGAVVRHRAGRSRRVPLLAAGDAGLAAHADVEVDHERQLRHRGGPFPATYASHAGVTACVPGNAGTSSNVGCVAAGSSASAGRMRTRTSYHPA